MKKAYYLSTCDTCKRILKEINVPDIELQDIKTKPITEEQLEELYKHTESYEALFNKRARLYREKDLKSKNLTEDEIKNYILEEYTFLKRPAFIIDDEAFIGNSKKVVESLKNKLNIQ